MSPSVRRRALRLGVASGILWSIGNGWTTGSLVTYLAQDLGAQGSAIGALLAWQSLAGTTRLVAPAVIGRLGGLKPAALRLLLFAYALLALLPVFLLGSQSVAVQLTVFVALICVHQFFENLGFVAVLSWLAELAPSRLRGRYFATRQRWQLIAGIPTSLAAAQLVDYLHGPARGGWKATVEPASGSAPAGYLLVMAAGAVFLLLSVVPLWRMPAVAASAGERPTTRPARSAFRDGRFVRLLMCVCWLSFANGISQSALSLYPKQLLRLNLQTMMLLPRLMQVGQLALTPWVGRFSDRFGNRPTLLVCQAVVALGPLFYLVASPAHPFWIVGAYICWSAFVGLNVCLPNLTFRLAPPSSIAQYTSVYLGLSGLAYGLTTLAAGRFLDAYRDYSFLPGLFRLDVFAFLFAASGLARLFGVVLVAQLREPGAWTWREIIVHWRSAPAETVVASTPGGTGPN